MTITKEQNGTALKIALEGRLDTMTAPELECFPEQRRQPDAGFQQAGLYFFCRTAGASVRT